MLWSIYLDTILYYIHQVPALRGFRITRVFSGTKMRVTRGLGVRDVQVSLTEISPSFLGPNGSYEQLLST